MNKNDFHGSLCRFTYISIIACMNLTLTNDLHRGLKKSTRRYFVPNFTLELSKFIPGIEKLPFNTETFVRLTIFHDYFSSYLVSSFLT